MTTGTSPFVGSLNIDGQLLLAGFLAPPSQETGAASIYELAQRAAANTPAVVRGELSTELRAELDLLQRGEFAGDISDFAAHMASEIESIRGEVSRAITTGTNNVPIRENLEAPAITLIPQDTPFRNMLPRTIGSGLASSWRQIVSLGGGWGSTLDQPGGGTVQRIFMSETGAPTEFTTQYSARNAPYKILAAFGKVSDFAAAAGASFSDLVGIERRNTLSNLMLNEENALINGDSLSVAAPWGDGTTPLAFDGILALSSTANGVPSSQIQTGVGAFTLAHFDAQTGRIFSAGGDGVFALMNQLEMASFQKTFLGDGGRRQLMDTNGNANITAGGRIVTYIHPVWGKPVSLMVDRFMPAGTIEFGAMSLPDGSAAMDVQVLPQAVLPADIQRPEGSPHTVQGYSVIDLARSLTQPGLIPHMVSVFEVFRLKSALHVGKSSGILPA